ncbi:MAG: hypothetical protein WC556_13140 [Candidatus Methanoperedens sp.]
MSEDASFNRDQKKVEERGVALDLSGSMGKGMLAKEKIETLGNSSGLTPLGFGVNVRTSSLLNCSDQYAENTEMPGNSPGLKTLHPFDEIYSIKKKSVSLIEGISNNEDLETLRNSSGLSPLNYDTEPSMDAGKHRNSPQRTLRPQSQIITNFAYEGE